jgi:hypothetical protein
MFECEYCKTPFLTEVNYNKHKCDQETRMGELDTRRGISAFRYYRLWFEKRKLLQPKKETFIVSKYYNTFFKFAEFAKDMGIPDVDLYIELMSLDAILPAHWYNKDIYAYFIEKFDTEYSPTVHTRVTLGSMERIAKALDCPMSEIFTHLKPSDVIKLTQSRNLSPWVLLLSKQFKVFYQTQVNTEERQLLMDVIKLGRWKLIMETKKHLIPETKAILDQLDL